MNNIMFDHQELLTIKEASIWASKHLNKKVTTSNISYLINYGRIKKINSNSNTLIDKYDLMQYYESFKGRREIKWKEQLGEDLNWALSFDTLKEAETTKHVHRLHPYKGKFIPQLVEYFLDNHTDDFKKEVYFKKGDIIIDPFCGSGTTLVQANELGMHAIGIDISPFNVLISNVKIDIYDIYDVYAEIQKITDKLRNYISDSKTVAFENKLIEELSVFNNIYFPVPDYKYKVKKKEIDEDKYGVEKEKEFLPIYLKLIEKYGIQIRQANNYSFLDKWYLKHVRSEIDFVFNLLKQIENIHTKKIISIILSRTIRSCRATTHADLATLKEPVLTTYYCSKHGKICKPLFSILSWWERYSKDTIKRLVEFDKLKTNTYQICLTGDSRTINIINILEMKHPRLAEIVKKQKISGIFSSPPYVGLINYHDQHAYAYDLFGFDRNDELEIGPLYKGKGQEARNSYINEISKVLCNCKQYLAPKSNIFIVANDKFNIYPIIADKSEMKIINQFKRPVLNRTERDKGAYSETIFQLVWK